MNNSCNNTTASDLETNILIAYHVLRMVIAVVAIFANCLTIFSICKFTYLRTAANMCIASLALSDFLNSAVVAVLSVLIDVHEFSAPGRWFTACTVKQTLQLALNGASFGSLLLIAVDRYICVVHPFRYEMILTIKKTVIALISMWVGTILATIIVTVVFRGSAYNCQKNHCRFSDVIRRDVFKGAVIPVFLFYLIATCALYLKIAFVARGHVTVIANQTASMDRDGSRRYKREAQLRITKTMAIVLGLYFVMYVPSIITNSILTDTSPLSKKVLNYVLGLFWWSNAWVNPFIYAWRCPNFNEAFRTLLFRCNNDDD